MNNCMNQPNGALVFRIDDDLKVMIPYLRFRKSAPISWHIEPFLAKRNLISLLTPISQDSMGGALRIRARHGLGVAWLPHSVVEPDVDAKQLA